MVTIVADAKILVCAVDTLAVNATVANTFVLAVLTPASTIAAGTVTVVRARAVLTHAVSALVVPKTLVDVLVTAGGCPSSGAVTAVAGDVIVAGGTVLARVRAAFVLFVLAASALVAIETVTSERILFIDAYAMDTPMLLGVTYVGFTVGASPGRIAFTCVLIVTIDTGGAIEARL